MRLSKSILYSAAGFLSVAAIGAITAPKLGAAIKAAFVEVVIPSKPFYDSISLNNQSKSIGPDGGTLGVSTITLTNFDSAKQQVFIFAPIFASGGCGGSGSTIIGGSQPRMIFIVQPGATETITYPTPLVYGGVNGHTCVAAEVTTSLNGGSVQMTVNGFVN